MTTNENRYKIHVPTLIAISLIAWALVNVLHEIVGHGGASILVGVPVKAVSTSTIYMSTNWDQYVAEHGLNPIRLILAGGTIANFITGTLALMVLGWRKVTSAATRYFLWLFASFSMVIVATNMVTNPLLGFGDWGGILSDLEPKNIWKTVIIGTGLVLMIAGYIFSLRLWMPQLKGHRTTLLGITAIPVITMIVVQTLSMLKSPFTSLPPEQNHLLASVFAYIHFLLWALVVNLIPIPRSSDTADTVQLSRSNAWLALGLAVFVFYVFVLGPGIGSFIGDPRLR